MSDPVTGTPDSVRIRANVQKMLDGGAKREEIDRYLREYEGAQPAGDPQTGDINLGSPQKGQPIVTNGPLTPVGVDAQTIARAKAGEFGLAKAIDATRALDYPRTSQGLQSPDDMRGQLASIGRDVNRRTAPGLLHTAANVAVSHLADPISSVAAEGASDEAVRRYLDGGQGVSPLAANVLGAAAFGGNVAGNVGVGKAIGVASKGVGAVAGEVAPRVGQVLNATRAGRLASHAIAGGVSNAALGGAGAAIEGEDLPHAAIRAGAAGVQGAVAGAVLGSLVELPGLSRQAKQLAAQMFGRDQENVQVAVRDAYLAKLSPEDRTYILNEPKVRDVFFPEQAPKPGPAAFDDGPGEPPPRPPETTAPLAPPSPEGGAPVSALTDRGGTVLQEGRGTTPEQQALLARLGVARPEAPASQVYPVPEALAPEEKAALLQRVGVNVVNPPQMNEAGFYGDHGNATVAVEPGTKIEGDGALDTVTAVRQAVAKVGADAFRQQADAEIARRGAQGDIDASKAAVEQVARNIATGKTSKAPVPFEGTVYHGTTKNFDTFQTGHAPGWGEGIYFTDNAKQAGEEFGHGPNGRVITAHVSLQNPYRGETIPERVLENTKAYQRVAARYPDVTDAWQEDSRFVGDALRELGYDGIVADGSNNIDGKEIVAFHPHQARIAQAPAEKAPVAEPTPEGELVSAGDVEHRHSLFGLDPATRQVIKTGYRSAMVTPYADAEVEAPELVAALHKGGASMARATHIASRRTALVLEGLTPEQRTAFGQQLRYDNLVAARDAATDPQIKQNFDAQAATAAQSVPPGTDEQPWFQQALAKHKQYIEQPLQEAALQAGVDPNSLRKPKSGYLRLVSEDRLQHSEIRRAMDATNSAQPDEIQPRSRFTKALIGERPEVQRLFPKGTEGFRQGALPKNAGYPGESVPNRKGTTQTGSAKQAQGTAREYASDYVRVIAEDARDKAVRAARNNVYAEVVKIGRPLGEKEAPALGKTVIAFDDSKGIATGGTGSQRFEVSKNVRDAVTRFHQQLEAKPSTSAASAFKKISGGLTQAQLSGMPVEATSHANTVASIVASVPGEKDAIGKGLTLALPGLGAKAAAIREMGNIDFSAPDIRALEMRLADIGALRVEEPRGGLLNTAHHWLFGPEGVDTRGRLVLARKYLARNPNATDEALREFVTSKLGNYVAQNSGALVNGVQSTGLTAFARFQASRIPGSIRSTFGFSGLPSESPMQRAGDIANTLYRGPVGHVLGTNAVNYALTGHSTFDNEKGHALDVDLNTTVGPDSRPLFVPGATINPVVATGLRASGAKAVLMSPRDGMAGRIADAVRDIANQGLASLSPAARFGITAATGRSPYLVGDNSFLKVVSSQPDRDKQLGAQLEAAVGQANPALHAFAAEGGDLTGHSLAGALSEDGRLFGGPKATAARIGEFLVPRMLTSGVGGPNQDLSATMIQQHDYQAALQDATREVQHAAGPEDAQKVADKWIQRFRDAGFNTLPVEAAFRKAMNMPDYAREARAGAAVQKFRNKNIAGPSTLPDLAPGDSTGAHASPAQVQLGQDALDRLLNSPLGDTLKTLLKPTGKAKPLSVTAEPYRGILKGDYDKQTGKIGIEALTALLQTAPVLKVPDDDTKWGSPWVPVHEMAHRQLMQSADKGKQMLATFDSIDANGPRPRDEYSEYGAVEHEAQATANAIDFIRATRSYTALPATTQAQVADALNRRERDIPGTKLILRSLLANPLLQHHPLRAYLTELTKPQAAPLTQ